MQQLRQRCTMLLVLLASVMAMGQAKVTIKCATVRSIITAPDRKSATIEIVNHSATAITAFAFAYDITLIDGQHDKGERMTDYIYAIAAAQMGHPPSSDHGPIQPGEVRSEVFLFGAPDKVAALAVTIETVIFMDLTSETTNAEMLDRFIDDRTDMAQIEAGGVDAITAALQDEHPFNSAHDRMLKIKHSGRGTAQGALKGDMANLENRTFASVDEERKYLAGLLSWHRSYATTIAAHAKIVRHQ